MKVLVATVGGSEEPVVVAARKLGLDKAILITGRQASEIFDEPIKFDVNPQEVSEKIKEKLENLGAEVEIIMVNPFDFEECCIKTLEAIEKRDCEVNVIISGGTKIQALAASYAAFICRCRMFYAQETKEGSELVEIPLTFSEIDELTSSRRSVLKVLEDGDTAENVAEKLSISRKTASQYLKELREYGLVEAVNGRVKRYRLTFAGRICKVRWG